MLEKEIKILNINKEKTRSKLTALGARCTFSGHIFDIGFSHKDKTLPYKLRVRKTSKGSYITYKQQVPGHDKRLKVRKELEFSVDRQSTLQGLLSQGFEVSYLKYKHRSSFSLQGVVFDIDTFSSIPSFLEIEHDDDTTIFNRIHVLGLHEHETGNYGTKKLFSRYGKKKCRIFV